ncbi:HlyD family type I secretion periplasmic adaptor subunit [Sphingobium sp.]|uniref:HlyD family type I secretion periplasmic adaptor subunit n=1 Tax=Sphingobium sp. TaxID=1912891 RepID=UPI002C42BE38|nr:HlyD family type I secretion periplasmic adaptor subunit [Sphingobium sp.]HUD94097.1 HlyD family type I secretion periplasmic adaptor subunit [Sphingobium sp.]
MKLDFLTGSAHSGSDAGNGGGKIAAGRPTTVPRHDPVPGALDDARPVIRVGLGVAILFFGLLVGFALLAPISGASQSVGEVTASGTPIIIQPERGGVINQYQVTEGQMVEAGQPLVRLNGVRSAAEAQQAQARRDALRAQQTRLTAERDGSEAIAFPPDLMARASDPAVTSAMQAQQAIFVRHRSVMQADRRIADTQLATAQAQRVSSARQLALIRDELASVQTLYDKGFARKSQLRALQRSAAQLEADTRSGVGDVERTSLQARRVSDEQAMQVATQLGEVEEQLAQVDPALKIKQYDARRDLLRSPVDGRISGLARLGPGSVLSPGQTVMEVVPSARALIVETRIKPTDIDDVRVGAPVKLNFTSVKPSGQTSFNGKVLTLSPARVKDGEKGEDHYRAQIGIDDPRTLMQAGIRLQPGLPVSVQVVTRDRTVFDYLFSPLIDTMRTGFREE